ncbi:hypothetical protein SAMN04487897_11373 [Paenibacillus sp. yr247]|nr:hypothetical protein SAMN04487897_11373 [Paenibacillus sp. yr247]
MGSLKIIRTYTICIYTVEGALIVLTKCARQLRRPVEMLRARKKDQKKIANTSSNAQILMERTKKRIGQ